MNQPIFDLADAVGTIRTWLTEADRVLITAGAGLSAAAGYDYGDEDRFEQLFPALHRRGLRSRYMVGVPLPPALLWGYWAVHIDDVRFSTAPNPLYQRLRALVDGKDHWVMTSNVDGLFARGGFAPDRIFTPQGDYGRYQCSTPCTPATWDSRPLVGQLLAAYDPATGAVTDPDAPPRCPNCGGEAEINVRVGPQFVDTPYPPRGAPPPGVAGHGARRHPPADPGVRRRIQHPRRDPTAWRTPRPPLPRRTPRPRQPRPSRNPRRPRRPGPAGPRRRGPPAGRTHRAAPGARPYGDTM
ncbi:LOW QUALITY PROTEIN: conserved hypothetical protein, partial [Streptomyces himastatinicus ATCC 53653]